MSGNAGWVEAEIWENFHFIPSILIKLWNVTNFIQECNHLENYKRQPFLNMGWLFKERFTRLYFTIFLLFAFCLDSFYLPMFSFPLYFLLSLVFERTEMVVSDIFKLIFNLTNFIFELTECIVLWSYWKRPLIGNNLRLHRTFSLD